MARAAAPGVNRRSRRGRGGRARRAADRGRPRPAQAGLTPAHAQGPDGDDGGGGGGGGREHNSNSNSNSNSSNSDRRRRRLRRRRRPAGGEQPRRRPAAAAGHLRHAPRARGEAGPTRCPRYREAGPPGPCPISARPFRPAPDFTFRSPKPPRSKAAVLRGRRRPPPIRPKAASAAVPHPARRSAIVNDILRSVTYCSQHGYIRVHGSASNLTHANGF
jgi:hypothetical protein